MGTGLSHSIRNVSDDNGEQNIENVPNEYVPMCADYFEVVESSTQWEMVNVQEFQDLKQSSQQLAKFKKTIERMEFVIKSKDAQLRELRKKSEHNQNKGLLNISNLTNVSIEIFFFFSFSSISICSEYF